MKSDEILLLVRAGYTRQEIEAMDHAPAAAPAAPAPAAPVEDQAQPAPAADPVPPAQNPVPVTNDGSDAGRKPGRCHDAGPYR